jgi:hypothetical protein
LRIKIIAMIDEAKALELIAGDKGGEWIVLE